MSIREWRHIKAGGKMNKHTLNEMIDKARAKLKSGNKVHGDYATGYFRALNDVKERFGTQINSHDALVEALKDLYNITSVLRFPVKDAEDGYCLKHFQALENTKQAIQQAEEE